MSFCFEITNPELAVCSGTCVGNGLVRSNFSAMASAGGIQIPSRLPLLLTHEGVLLPGSTVRFSVDSPRNMQLVSQRLLKGTSLKSTIIGVIPNTRDPEQDSDPLPPLHQ
ncbi:Lon protease-like protein 2 [Xenoophorus captivus]|uniref:Lon protease-like protein 2 n=1 Tax=Xenoophorus captivus TaxID=1517983 RepID=A0ABV0R8Z1_9TELE